MHEQGSFDALFLSGNSSLPVAEGLGCFESCHLKGGLLSVGFGLQDVSTFGEVCAKVPRCC